MSRASAARSVVGYVKRRGRPAKVGHHAMVPRPKRFYVQLDNNYLSMLIIPKEFRTNLKGRPYPQHVIVQSCKECEWVVHANRYKGEVVLDKGWPAFTAFHDLKMGDFLILKVTTGGFKIQILDRVTSCEKVFICLEHGHLD